ncbi:hypothetical protein ACIP68_22925 [Streptomyces griseoviridis]
MSAAVAPAALPAAPRPQPHAAAAGARPRDGGATVKVPLRLVVGAQYPDGALSAYVKVKALARRPEGCRAKVIVIAGYLGMSKSAIERALRALARPDDIDGIVEVPTTRKTSRDGRGESAHRTTRPLTDDELWVRIPVRAAEALTPRLLRLYALLAYATARRFPVTIAELAAVLLHHTGKKAGLPLTDWQVRRLVHDLAATGWLTLRDREGERGRHAYETHRHPLHAVPAEATPPATTAAETPEPEPEEGTEEEASGSVPDGEPQITGQLPLWGDPSPDFYDGSGPSDHDGSLASEEDLQTDRPRETQLGGGIRRRRTAGTGPAPVDNRVPDTFGQGALRADTSAGRPATSQQQRLSARQWDAVRAVLDPVAHEVTALTSWEQRRTAREIVRQLEADGATVERLADRIERRYARTTAITSFPRWLIGAALTRHGCGDPRCETGTIWETGLDCELCAVNRQTRNARAQRERDLEAAEQRTRTGRGSGGRDEDAFREAVQAEERQRRDAGRERARLLAELAARGEVLPRSAAFGTSTVPDTGAEPEPLPEPVKKTYRERSAAPEGEIRAAIRALGPEYALHVYGTLRALPLINALIEQASCGADGPELGPEMPAPSRIREQADRARTGMRRRPAPGDIAAPCPTCRVPAGQPCTTPRGRRRATAHHARPTTAADATAPRGEET